LPQKNNKNEAARIMTGAVIPEGADAVVRQEDTLKEGKTVTIYTSAKKEKISVLPGKMCRKMNSLSKREVSSDRRILECSPPWARLL